MTDGPTKTGLHDVASPSDQLGALASGLINTFAVSRMIIGGSCLLIPQHATQFFSTFINDDSIIIARLFGSRDLVLGAFLWIASKSTLPASRAERRTQDWVMLRQALYLGLAVDTLDGFSSIFGFLNGSLGGAATGWIGGGAMAFCGLGLLGVRMCMIR